MKDLRGLKKEYGLTVRVSPRLVEVPKTVKLEPLKDLIEYAAEDVSEFRDALKVYPPEFIRDCNISQLLIANDIEHRIGERWISVAGLAFSNGPIYFDMVRPRIVHHEILHRADQQPGALSDRGIAQWKELNNPLLPYLGDAYWDLNSRQLSKVNCSGYAEVYGRHTFLDDRATVAEELMVYRGYKSPFGNNPILREKVKVLKRDYANWSDGRMDERYFADLKAGEVDRDYWKNRKFFFRTA